MRDDRDTDVACGTCSACCTSSYFVTLRPTDVAARRHVPAEHLVDAPSGPPGTQLIGYDARGHCPMLRDGRCSIYAHRPQTCRTYDCRVYAAAGIGPGPDKPAIAARVRAWEFTYASAAARLEHEAVKRAAQFMRNDATSFPPGSVPVRPSEVAVAAVKVYAAFLGTEVPEDAAGKGRLATHVVALLRDFATADAGGRAE
ncbi:MAG: YkgJ family cysteine cluster protein [Steroidobacteraceae bacterium]|nr:YkgJ family cysteine cluster protein [Steroidobacteraceae bacterium]